MRRSALALLAVAITLPGPAVGQGFFSSSAVTPFVGYIPGFTTRGDLGVRIEDQSISGSFDQEVEGGPVFGLVGEGPLGRLATLRGEVAWSRMGGVASTFTGPLTSEASDSRGPDILLAKLGLGLRVPIGLPITLSLSPALIRLDPADEEEEHEFTRPHINFGLSVGGSTDFPLSRRLGLVFAAEDYLIFWNEEEQEERLRTSYGRELGVPVDGEVSVDPSHIPLIWMGLSFRF